jgi:hypothetical protein
MEKNSSPEPKFMLTSLDFKIKKSLNIEEKKEDFNIIPLTSKSFPKIRYRTLDKSEYSNFKVDKSKEEKIFLRNLKKFISPINKSNLEIKEFKNIKKNLIINKFKEMHNYKLKINPKNYYKNFGLNEFITISTKNKNKSRNNTYRYNNISSYNNIFKTEDDIKNNLVVTQNKKDKELLLTCIPYLLKKSKNNNGIFKFFNNKKLIDEYSIWRGKNINDMIHNNINLDFFKNFLNNSKSLGKIKISK